MASKEFLHAYEQVCDDCGAPAPAFKRNVPARFCDSCNALVHPGDSGPPYVSREKAPESNGGHGEDVVMSAAREGRTQTECPSELGGSRQACSWHPGTPLEKGFTQRQLGSSDELNATGWISSSLLNSLADHSFEVNGLDIGDDLDFFLDAESLLRPSDGAAKGLPSRLDLTRASDMCRDKRTRSATHASGNPQPEAEANSSKESITCPDTKPAECPAPSVTTQSVTRHTKPPAASADPARVNAAAVMPAAVDDATTATCSSAMPLIPCASHRGVNRQSVMANRHSGTAGITRSVNTLPLSQPPSQAASMSQVTPAAAPAAEPAPMPTMPAMPMMQCYMPQPMMQPMMMWPGGGCVAVPMFPQQAWATYMPATLQPRADPAAHEAYIQARRTKHARFQEKKRQLSCRNSVRYASRKRYADARPRVNGRFISKTAAAAASAAAAAAAAVPVSGETPGDDTAPDADGPASH